VAGVEWALWGLTIPCIAADTALPCLMLIVCDVVIAVSAQVCGLVVWLML
jgi:energy-converting hydrogenase Eha subunit G